MISIEKCREHLGDVATQMSDEQVIEFRDTLYVICEQLLDKYIDEGV
jgi:hypothetical protein